MVLGPDQTRTGKIVEISDQLGPNQDKQNFKILGPILTVRGSLVLLVLQVLQLMLFGYIGWLNMKIVFGRISPILE